MKRKKDENLGREIELEIENLGTEGVSVGRLDGIVYFVKGGLPQERVKARITRKHRRYYEAEVVEVLTTSEGRCEAPCVEFGVCGGCKWQHLKYEEQVKWKRQHVVDAFHRLVAMPEVVVNEAVPANTQYGYRNKMEFSFGASKWLTTEEIASGEDFNIDFALGLHVPGRFDKVRDLETCHLQTDTANLVLSHTREIHSNTPLTAYHQRMHEGFLRHLVVRSSSTNGAILAVLITTSPRSDEQMQFVEDWLTLFDQLPAESSLIHAVNDTWSPVATGDIMQCLGPGVLVEVSHGVSYRVSPFSFFQTNTVQLPALVSLAINASKITSDDVVWDLYCGTGTLSLPACKTARKVIGVELAESSVLDARNNAQLNGITNAEFHAVDLHSKKAIEFLKQLATPDVVIIDPPRSGMHPQVVEHLLELAPSRISYVSCNPATQARDCKLLSEKYKVLSVTPIDMFPQTYHVESVAELVLIGA